MIHDSHGPEVADGMKSNEIFHIAKKLVAYTNLSLFLTGKAGTGKTTFLKSCKDLTFKNIVVLAPTGVAAMNSGGTTIHSFFRLPFSPIVPRAAHESPGDTFGVAAALEKIRLNQDRKSIIEQLDLIIIDEISMVRCDVMDAIDLVLRIIRNQPGRAFGGVQMLFIGDLFQLPPVIKDDDWRILSGYYRGPYFFNSRVIEANPPVYLELNEIFRQGDPEFISLLNGIRHNNLQPRQIATLQSRFIPYGVAVNDEGYITLTTHNSKADLINIAALSKIDAPEIRLQASIEGEFYEKSFPADYEVRLKVGAQVMFLRNDIEKPRRYYNGKIGKVIEVTADKVIIACLDNDAPIEIKRETWKNIRYTLGHKSEQVEEEELGTFTQFPLRLAWAITIHKSQGLTFDKTIIDAGDAFVPGQVYVALSRCTALENIILRSRINTKSLQADARIISYVKAQDSPCDLASFLDRSVDKFQKELVRNLFNFDGISNAFELLGIQVKQSRDYILMREGSYFKFLEKHVLHIYTTSIKFLDHLDELFNSDQLLCENPLFLQRFEAAKTYFVFVLSKAIHCINENPMRISDIPVATKIDAFTSGLVQELAFKIHLLSASPPDFSVEGLLQTSRSFVQAPCPVGTYDPGTRKKQEFETSCLLNLLETERDLICHESGVAPYFIARHHLLINMSKGLPNTPEDLISKIGMEPEYCRQYGTRFLRVIEKYLKLHPLKDDKEGCNTDSCLRPVRRNRLNTRKQTLELFNTGMTIKEIAKERNMKPGTIEKHLVHLIKSGELATEQLVERNKPWKESQLG